MHGDGYAWKSLGGHDVFLARTEPSGRAGLAPLCGVAAVAECADYVAGQLVGYQHPGRTNGRAAGMAAGLAELVVLAVVAVNRSHAAVVADVRFQRRAGYSGQPSGWLVESAAGAQQRRAAAGRIHSSADPAHPGPGNDQAGLSAAALSVAAGAECYPGY